MNGYVTRLLALFVQSFQKISDLEYLSHPGVKTTKSLVQRTFVWPNMRRDITRQVQECQQCARSK